MFKTENTQMIGIALAVGGAILFSTKGVLVKLSYEEGVSTIGIIALRMAFSLPFFVWIAFNAYTRKRPALKSRDVLQVIVCGLLSYYLASWLSFYGLHFISVQLERLILFSYPAIVVIAISVLNRRLPNVMMIGATSLTYLGILLVFGQEFTAARHGSEVNSFDVIIGSGLVTASAFSFAAFVVLSKPMITKLGSALFTGLSMMVAAFAVLIHAGVAAMSSGGFGDGSMSSTILVYGLILGLVGTVIPALMLNEANGRIGPERTAVLGTTGPIATSVMAVMILSEPFTLWHLAALGLSVAGISLIVRSARR